MTRKSQKQKAKAISVSESEKMDLDANAKAVIQICAAIISKITNETKTDQWQAWSSGIERKIH